MSAIVQMGTQWVIVTQGKAGAMVSDGQSFWHAPAIDIQPISSIGSGDAFTAGLAAAISRGKSVPEACQLASACAAANALIPGSGILRIEDVKRLEPLGRV
jgi:fructose-1-phosphate kinase PfkB-like protein